MIGRDLVAADIKGVSGSNLHGKIGYHFLEIVSTGHEIGLAVHFDDDTDLPAHMDVRTYDAFAGGTARPLGSG